MIIKKIKLPLNPYSQLLVHNVVSTFSGKRRDRYRVIIFSPVLKLDLEATVVIRMLMRSHANKGSPGNRLQCSFHQERTSNFEFCFLLSLDLISVIFTWFLLSSYLLKFLVFLYFFWFDLIFIYIYLFNCVLKEWEDFILIYKGFTCKVGLGQLNQVNLHPARHEFKRRPTQLNLSPTGVRN